MKKFLRILKRTMIVLCCLIAALAIVAFFYMKQPQFGALPEGKRLELIEKSPHYKDGKFRNLVEKPTIADGHSVLGEIWTSLTKKFPHTAPEDSLPSIKTNLKTIPTDSNVIVWFGHSSFFLQVDGVKILVDPVFSGTASPLPWGVKSYKGSDIYTVDDMPTIDYMLLSHDHYDHLDYETVKELQQKVRYVVCGLGNGAHYQKWSYTTEQILEKDWGDSVNVKQGFTIFTETTHHASGRGFRADKSLWLSFFIQAPTMNIYYSGDGGYSNRFKIISEKYPVIDWAVMECGQYNPAWQSVHELPQEVALATIRTQSKKTTPCASFPIYIGQTSLV